MVSLALIIIFNDDNKLENLKKCFGKIGKISYSLYLWHFPILVLGNNYFENYNDLLKIFSIFLCFLISIITYNIIENNASLFNEFEALIKQIISDDKIDMRDAPAIILLLKLVYEFIYNEKNKEIGSEDITQLASFLLKESFNLLLTEDIIQVNSDKKDSLTSSFNSLIDVCAELINLNSTLFGFGLFTDSAFRAFCN